MTRHGAPKVGMIFFISFLIIKTRHRFISLIFYLRFFFLFLSLRCSLSELLEISTRERG